MIAVKVAGMQATALREAPGIFRNDLGYWYLELAITDQRRVSWKGPYKTATEAAMAKITRGMEIEIPRSAVTERGFDPEIPNRQTI